MNIPTNQAKLICTLGPGSKNKEVVGKMKSRGVSLFRINMSHTRIEDLEPIINELRGYDIEICLDTEGCQVRTGYQGAEPIELIVGTEVKLYNDQVECDSSNIYIRPQEVFDRLDEGDIISLDFNSAMLKVIDMSPLKTEGFVLCEVQIGGMVGNNKGVAIIGKEIKLPAYSEKDKQAIEIGKKHKIKYFTLSFMDHPDEVQEFKDLFPECTIYSKIETRLGLENYEEILKLSDGILIDRGDMSREVQIERIPLIQKILINRSNQLNKECFVATNIMESMCTEIKPNRAEVNDVINTLQDGATGLVLTKETAVGNHPVETVNMAMNLIEHHAQFTSEIDQSSLIDFVTSSTKGFEYINEPELSGLLIAPHGGRLVNRMIAPTEKAPTSTAELTVDDFTIRELELIANGTFSPLEGFLDEENLISVLDRMRLLSDLIWTIPIVLRVTPKEAESLQEGQTISLVGPGGKQHATLGLSQKYSFPIDQYCLKLFNTLDPQHPGVSRMQDGRSVFLAGKITLLNRNESEFQKYNLSPAQVRTIFTERGWAKVIGFHTRNIIHRSHEFIQLSGLEKSGCDGLFVHPAIGQKKTGDFQNKLIMDSYEVMIKNFYPKNKVVLAGFTSNSYYGGPREAVFTALCRKNFGCSHFIVGRDHTGVFDFYKPFASQEIFERFPDIGIEIIKFKEVSFSRKKGYYFKDDSAYENVTDDVQISGSSIREMLKNNVKPDSFMMRDEVFDVISSQQSNNNDIFV